MYLTTNSEMKELVNLKSQKIIIFEKLFADTKSISGEVFNKSAL